MTIDNVDQLIQSIFEIPEDAVKSASDWLEITRLLAEFIAKADDLLVIQTYSDRYETCHPYLQICYEDDRAMTIEAVSNKFLRPKLSIDAQNTMLELGWELSDDPNLPNYFKFLHKEDATPDYVAQLFTMTLRCVYGIGTDDTIEISTGKGVWSNHGQDA
jgi:hypothetical protein